MNEEKLIQRDRMRFVKNSMCANLCYLGLLFDVFYFVLLYRRDEAAPYYYSIQIGASIVYNLLFLLIVFLSSEGVKNYGKSYSYILFAAGVMQVVRIFVIPMNAHSTPIDPEDVQSLMVMTDAHFLRCTIYLIISAVCLIVSAVVNIIRCNTLEAHNKYLESQNA